MKGLFLAALLLLSQFASAQLLRWSPAFIEEGSSTIEITIDATKGNQGLKDYGALNDVYVHIGAITTNSTSSADWKYVKFAWGVPDISARATSLGNNRWKFTINGGLRAFYGITNTSEKIRKIAILFRNGNGSQVQRNADATDMYIPVYESGLQVRIDTPLCQPTYIPTPEPVGVRPGESLRVYAVSNGTANHTLFFNGTSIASTNASTSIAASVLIGAAGNQEIVARATVGSVTSTDTLRFFVAGTAPILPLPPGVRDGINYEPGDTSAILVLYAPLKSQASVLGDFNNWTESVPFQMNRTPDGNRYWLRITGLTPGTEYAYQYLVDGNIKLADYLTEKVLDPDNDKFIPFTTYPNLKAYPEGKTSGIVGILQTRKPAYVWNPNGFIRPDKRNLLVYELLLRDFLALQDWKTLKDTLSYLKRLGVNVVELMPINEFEGNNSWGYNPSFYLAPDKYYGTENALKEFIDSCHQNGIAVVLDIALNHSFGQSPMVRLYWDAVNNRPAANSPWFNPEAKHPFNVGYDINHESQATRDFVDRVVEHWLVNYRIDGFRWDLSKGFTQVNNPNDVAAWGRRDQSRIAIWKRIYDKMQAVAAGSYCILEHFAENSEEQELSDYGMLLWGNSNFNFNEATMGFLTNSNFESGVHRFRNWNNPHLITYMESHDEERLQFKNISFGNTANPGHNAKDPQTALRRNAMAAALWAIIPGPKMLWQFGELGYDFSITYCPATNSVPLPYPNQSCRTDPKPVRWDYAANTNRKALYETYAKLLALRRIPNYLGAFTTNNVTWSLGGAVKNIVTVSDSLSIVAIGNFDVQARTGSVTFPTSGTWYSYLTTGTRVATGAAENITLQPGEYYVYTSRDINNPLVTSINDLRPDYSDNSLIVYPNPLQIDSRITYEIPVSGRVQISLLNVNGQKMAELFKGIKPRGRHSLPLDGGSLQLSRLTSGTYLVLVEVNGRRMVKRVLVQ